jgi:hypothetical protein
MQEGSFVRRRLAASAIAASLMLSVFASPAAAETGPNVERLEFDRIQAGFEFSEGGRDFNGQILIDRNTETGASIASFYFSSGVSVLCDMGTPDDPSDDEEFEDLIDFTANEAPPASLTIAAKLAGATASATAHGELKHFEACTGNETSSQEAVSWQLTLSATGPTMNATRVDRFPNDDGTVTKQTEKTSTRQAGGSVTVDGSVYDATGGSIAHILIEEKTN